MRDRSRAQSSSVPAAIAAAADIVLVTRIAAERDKRTYQLASTLNRLGHRATVVEGEPSDFADSPPFELITIEGAEPLSDPQRGTGPAATKPAPDAPAPAAPNPRIRRVVEVLPDPAASAVRRLGGGLIRSWQRLRNRWRLPLLLWRGFRRDNDLTFASLPAADVYYLTFFWQFPAVWRACRRGGVGLIYGANDAYWRWPGYRWYPLPFRAFLYAVERRCVRRASEVITVSEGVADLIERRYGRRPAVVRSMHDLRIDVRAGTDVRRASGLGGDAFLIVIVGNDKPSDAVTDALRALQQLPERVHLALLGRGYERHSATVSELGLGDRVHLLAPVAPSEVTSAIATADAALINTRAREVHLHALPTRLFSAVAAGLPILYPPLPEVRALAEEHGLGLPTDTESPDSIASAVRTLSEDPSLAGELRANVESAREQLNWEREEVRLTEIVAAALPARDEAAGGS